MNMETIKVFYSIIIVVFLTFSCEKRDIVKEHNERVIDFVDNTSKFKGTIQKMHCRYAFAPRNSFTLRGQRGGQCVFYDDYYPDYERNRAETNLFFITVYVPAELTVPNIDGGDEVYLEFECTEGSLNQGNIAVSIVRP